MRLKEGKKRAVSIFERKRQTNKQTKTHDSYFLHCTKHIRGEDAFTGSQETMFFSVNHITIRNGTQASLWRLAVGAKSEF